MIEQSGLRGRGGAAFPTATKMRAVRRARGRAIVVANGGDGEPSGAKDTPLLSRLPHLHRFVASQENAVVQHLNGGPALPTFVPPRPAERGVRGRPTLVQNVETLAHIALIARYGAQWFRELGPEAEPGSPLISLGGAVARPGVYEVERGTSLGELIRAAGGSAEPLSSALLGGYYGGWIAGAELLDLQLADAPLRELGVGLGAGVVFALPASACAAREVTRVAAYLADQSAGQCGPCVHGLRSIADTLQAVVDGYPPPEATESLRRWLTACRGAARAASRTERFASCAPDLRFSPASSLSTPATDAVRPARTRVCCPCRASTRWQPQRSRAPRRSRRPPDLGGLCGFRAPAIRLAADARRR